MPFSTSTYLYSTILLSLCHTTFLRPRGPEGNFAFNILEIKKNKTKQKTLQFGHKCFEANIWAFSIKLKFHKKSPPSSTSVRDERVLEKLPPPMFFLNVLGQKPFGGIFRGDGHLWPVTSGSSPHLSDEWVLTFLSAHGCPTSVWQLLGFRNYQWQLLFLTPACVKPLKISGLDETRLWIPQLEQDALLVNCLTTLLSKRICWS